MTPGLGIAPGTGIMPVFESRQYLNRTEYWHHEIMGVFCYAWFYCIEYYGISH
jgi:hypothetical protein